jgi:enoyl reductase-like protein
MSKTYDLLREAEASYQDNNRERDGYENLEKCLNELQLSHNQIKSQNYDALMDSYLQINTIIADPYKCLKLPKDKQTTSNAGLSDFLAKRRLEIIERIDKILKKHVFKKINELTLKIEDKDIHDKINQRVKQLEFLVVNKRSNWIDRLNFKQIIGEFGERQNVQPPLPHSTLEKTDSVQKENVAVRSIISRIFHRPKK